MRRLIVAAGAALALIGAASAQTSNRAPGSAAGISSSVFVNVPEQGELSSNLIGLDVYNNTRQNLGEIKDVAIGQNGQVDAYILSVGGILGVGEHFVAVKPTAVSIKYDSSDKKWHASMNATTAELKAAAKFKYTGRWNAART
jgi:sporulation protein YlmC with PRC-barrel domain